MEGTLHTRTLPGTRHKHTCSTNVRYSRPPWLGSSDNFSSFRIYICYLVISFHLSCPNPYGHSEQSGSFSHMTAIRDISDRTRFPPNLRCPVCTYPVPTPALSLLDAPSIAWLPTIQDPLLPLP